MKGYFSVGSDQKDMEMLVREGAKSIMLSYAHCKNRGIPDVLKSAVKKKKIDLMVDSGAFTNAIKPGWVKLDSYMEFLKSNAEYITEYTVLDDMQDRAVTLKNYTIMKSEGFAPQYVDHLWFAPNPEVEAVYDSGGKIGWSGLSGGKGTPANKARFEARLLNRALKARAEPHTPLHLFGVGQRLWRFLPHFDIVRSVDSSAWCNPVAKSGGISCFQAATKEAPVPRFKQLQANMPLPQDLRERIKSSGFDMRSDQDRKALAVREMLKYYSEITKFHKTAVSRGLDLVPLSKCVTDEEAEVRLVEIGKRILETEPNNRYELRGVAPIIKVDSERRLITGIVLEPDEVDAQNDTIKAEVIEEAAHKFLRQYNSGTQMGVQHAMFGNIGVELVESHVTKEDMQMGDEQVKKGSWLMTVHVTNDRIWSDVKEGKITGFSIGGVAVIEP